MLTRRHTTISQEPLHLFIFIAFTVHPPLLFFSFARGSKPTFFTNYSSHRLRILNFPICLYDLGLLWFFCARRCYVLFSFRGFLWLIDQLTNLSVFEYLVNICISSYLTLHYRHQRKLSLSYAYNLACLSSMIGPDRGHVSRGIISAAVVCSANWQAAAEHVWQRCLEIAVAARDARAAAFWRGPAHTRTLLLSRRSRQRERLSASVVFICSSVCLSVAKMQQKRYFLKK